MRAPETMVMGVPTVVIADDDEEMRALLARALECEGLAVVTVRDGAELVDAVDDLRANAAGPELIISDIQMPGCSGLRAVARLRDLGHTMPIVLITAFGDEETHEQAMRLGAAILDKPFDIYKLRIIAVELVRE